MVWVLPIRPRPPSSPATSCDRPWRWSAECPPFEKEFRPAHTGSARRPWGRSRTVPSRRYHTGEGLTGRMGQFWTWRSLWPRGEASAGPRSTGWRPVYRWSPESRRRREVWPEQERHALSSEESSGKFEIVRSTNLIFRRTQISLNCSFWELLHTLRVL